MAAESEDLRRSLLDGPLADRVPDVAPTPEQLREEIINGPLAEQLAPHWGNVFAPPDADPPQPESDLDAIGRWHATCASNSVKRNRAGRLTPDGAYDLLQVLTTAGRLKALGWTVTTGLIVQAHNEGVG